MKNEIDVIDLKQRFGQRYKIAKDPAAENQRNPDPMYWIMPCKFGEIFPYGGDFLAVMVISSKIANQMRNWPELEVTQDAEDAVIFKFHVDHFEKVAKRVGAKKKKRVAQSSLSNLIPGCGLDAILKSTSKKRPKSGQESTQRG